MLAAGFLDHGETLIHKLVQILKVAPEHLLLVATLVDFVADEVLLLIQLLGEFLDPLAIRVLFIFRILNFVFFVLVLRGARRLDILLRLCGVLLPFWGRCSARMGLAGLIRRLRWLSRLPLELLCELVEGVFGVGDPFIIVVFVDYVPLQRRHELLEDVVMRRPLLLPFFIHFRNVNMRSGLRVRVAFLVQSLSLVRLVQRVDA